MESEITSVGNGLGVTLPSFLDTAYFDNVLREKEKNEGPSIESVAESQIIGLIDIEYENKERTVCSRC